MNERIRELWNQSRYPSGRGHDEEKFALLIVRECADVVRHIDCQGGGNLGQVIERKMLGEKNGLVSI